MPAGRFCRPRLRIASSTPRKSAGFPWRPRTGAAAAKTAAGQDAVADRRILVESHAARVRNGDCRLAGQARHIGRAVCRRRSVAMKAPSLSDWLKARDLERFIAVFDENEVDLATL